MFRRSKPADEAATPPAKPDGKGRPTPTRKEAEAAAKARAKAPRTRRELAAAQRSSKAEANVRMRQALRTGDERNLPARDRGPVRRFVRDFVDCRFQFVEILLPVLLVTLVLGYLGNQSLYAFSQTLMLMALVLVAYDVIMLRFRLKRAMAERFPQESMKGLTYYAVMRALQIRFLRLPKPQVKIGQQLPETYR